MKKLLKLLIFVFLVSCNMKNRDQGTIESDPVSNKLIGFYEYRAKSGGNNQYILVDTLKGKIYGIYYRTEPKRGKGQSYYANSLTRVQLIGDSISFVLGDRKLFSSRPVLPGKKTGNIPESPAVVSSSALSFYGSLSNSSLRLRCSSGNGNCPEQIMNFRKIPLPE